MDWSAVATCEALAPCCYQRLTAFPRHFSPFAFALWREPHCFWCCLGKWFCVFVAEFMEIDEETAVIIKLKSWWFFPAGFLAVAQNKVKNTRVENKYLHFSTHWYRVLNKVFTSSSFTLIFFCFSAMCYLNSVPQHVLVEQGDRHQVPCSTQANVTNLSRAYIHSWNCHGVDTLSEHE